MTRNSGLGSMYHVLVLSFAYEAHDLCPWLSRGEADGEGKNECSQ